jgi:hypothetical protein
MEGQSWNAGPSLNRKLIMEGNADLKILSVAWLGLDASDKNKQPQNWSTQQADFNFCTLPSIGQQMTEMRSTNTFNVVYKLLTQGYAADPFSEFFLVPKGQVP